MACPAKPVSVHFWAKRSDAGHVIPRNFFLQPNRGIVLQAYPATCYLPSCCHSHLQIGFEGDCDFKGLMFYRTQEVYDSIPSQTSSLVLNHLDANDNLYLAQVLLSSEAEKLEERAEIGI